MMVPRQEYSRELKIACMRELDSGKGVAEVARISLSSSVTHPSVYLVDSHFQPAY
jgi:hypothetical protein